MFTPVHSLIGGLLLHISTSNFLADTGRVFGISGLLSGALYGEGRKQSWRWLSLAGLAVGPLVLKAGGMESLLSLNTLGGEISAGRMILAGLLVGFGSRLGSGCTSGHFLCGVSRLSPRSIVATGVFFTSAIITTHFFPLSDILTTPASPALVPTDLKLLLPLAAVPAIARAASVLASNSIPALIPLISGLVFSVGLAFSGMLSPVKVLAFMHVDKPAVWDPSLAMLVLTGVLPNWRHFVQVVKPSLKGKPKHAARWSIPTNTQIDYRLLSGALIFGFGWGLGGVCPGPAIVRSGAAVAGLMPWLGLQWFMPAMIAGMGLATTV